MAIKIIYRELLSRPPNATDHNQDMSGMQQQLHSYVKKPTYVHYIHQRGEFFKGMDWECLLEIRQPRYCIMSALRIHNIPIRNFSSVHHIYTQYKISISQKR